MASCTITAALEEIRRRNRSRMIEAHGTSRSRKTADYALQYLHTLQTKAEGLRGDADAIRGISLQSCLSDEVQATEFENIFHKRNLETIIERGLYRL